MPIEISLPDGTLDVDAANRALDEYAAANQPAESEGDEGDEEGDEDQEQTTADADDDSGAGDEEAAGEDAGEDWMLRDDIRELVDSLGISQEELKDFSGPEELERAARILDRNLMEEGRRIKPGEEQDAALVAAEAARAKAEAMERAAAQERGADGRFTKAEAQYKPEISSSDFDEQIVGEFDRLGKHVGDHVRRLEQQLEQLTGQLRQDAQRRELDSFDSIVDGMGHEDLFGQSADLDDKTKGNRAKLWEAVDTLRAGLASRGKQGGLTPTLVRRALNLEFADQISHQQRRSYAQRLQQQAQRKLGAGGQREATGTKRSWKGPPAKDPVLQEAYRELERENG